MSEECTECLETLYDLTELRGQNDDHAKLYQLVELLTRQNTLYSDSLQQLTKINQSLRTALAQTAREVKVEVGSLTVVEEIEVAAAGVASALGLALKGSKTVEVPIFV